MNSSPMPWPNFTEAELACPCGCGRMDMDAAFMEKLAVLREAFGSPLRISSAYRCSQFNMQCSDTGLTGPHVYGVAVDLLVAGEEAHRLLTLALQHGFTGVGISQKGPHNNRFLHLDTLASKRARPTIWTY